MNNWIGLLQGGLWLWDSLNHYHLIHYQVPFCVWVWEQSSKIVVCHLSSVPPLYSLKSEFLQTNGSENWHFHADCLTVPLFLSRSNMSALCSRSLNSAWAEPLQPVMCLRLPFGASWVLLMNIPLPRLSCSSGEGRQPLREHFDWAFKGHGSTGPAKQQQTWTRKAQTNYWGG